MFCLDADWFVYFLNNDVIGPLATSASTQPYSKQQQICAKLEFVAVHVFLCLLSWFEVCLP